MPDSLRIGLELTVFGMGLVFLLLMLLWGVMVLLVKLDRAAPRPAPSSPPSPPSPSGREAGGEGTGGEGLGVRGEGGGAASDIEPDKLAAITLAVKLHQEVRRARSAQVAPVMRDHSRAWAEIGRARQNQSWSPRRRG